MKKLIESSSIAENCNDIVADEDTKIRAECSVNNEAPPPDCKYKRTPIDGHGGTWSGERGNSKWLIDANDVPANKRNNPDELSWTEINAKYKKDITGITFRNGEPDFSEIAIGIVNIPNFSAKRYKNFSQADQQLAKQRGCTARDIKHHRKNNRLTWHERSDMSTMDLVPREYHSIPHSGGISKAKGLAK